MRTLLMTLILCFCGTLQAKIAWSPIEEMSQPNVLSIEQAMNSSDRWIMAWSRKTETGFVIELSEKRDQKTWTPAAEIISATHPLFVSSICVDAFGHMHLFWQEFVQGKVFLMTVEKGTEGEWNTPKILATHNYYFLLKTAQDPLGAVYAVWIKKGNEDLYEDDEESVEMAEKSPNTEWSVPSVLTENDSLGNMDIAVNSQGDVYIQWVNDYGSRDCYIQGVHKYRNGPWTAPYSLLICPGILWGKHELPALSPQIAFKPSGEVLSIFCEVPDPYRQRISITQKIDEEIWSEPLIISENRLLWQVSYTPNIAINSSGEIFSVWLTKEKDTGIILQGALNFPKSGWTKPTTIFNKIAENAKMISIPLLFLDPAGYPLAVLATQVPEQKTVLYFSLYDPSQGWVELETLSLDFVAKAISIDRDSAGTLVISWIQKEDGQSKFRTIHGKIEKD